MLEYLRNASERPAAKVLMGLLIFSFVGWGAADWIFGASTSDSVLATVGDTEITMTQFGNVRNAELAKLTREEQRATFANPAEFSARVLAQVVNDAKIMNRAADLGFVVTDRRVAGEIARIPEFFENGRFSAERFNMALMQNGMGESDFANVIRHQILKTMVLGPVSVPLAVPEFAVTAAYNARYASREIAYSAVAFDDFKVGDPTDAQLREYYAKNPKTIAATRVVTYALIPSDVSKPDEYDAGYATAQKLEDALISGESMDAAAKKHNAKFARIPAFARDAELSDANMTDALVTKVFAMDEGIESEIIETDRGFLILRVEKINPEHTAEFESVRGSLNAGWRRGEQKKQAYLRANEILTGGAKLGNAVTVTRASGAPNDVLVAAFRQTPGDAKIAEGQNAYYVVRVDKVVRPTPDAAKMDALRKELAMMSARMVIEDYNAFLQREYGVEINQKIFDRMYGG